MGDDYGYDMEAEVTKVIEYYQEKPQSHTTVQSVAPRGRITQDIKDILAHRIRISEILPWDRKSYPCYLTQDVKKRHHVKLHLAHSGTSGSLF